VISRQAVGPAACPGNYPIQLNDTSFDTVAFYLHVKANNPAYDGHNVQLRTLSSGVQSVVVDKASPVLAAQLREGVIYSEGRSLTNAIYDLGPTAVLTNTTGIGNLQRQRFDFSNTTAPAYGAGEVNVRNAWYLESLGDDGTYGLYHNVPIGIVNGFLICPVGSGSNKYYQLYYNEYQTSPGDLGKCGSIGLQTTIAPVIINGECTI